MAVANEARSAEPGPDGLVRQSPGDAFPYQVTGLLLGLEAVILAVLALVLGAVFDFPDILREPADVVLTRFNENSSTIRTTYYAFIVSGVLLVPIALLLYRLLTRARSSALMDVATAFGILAGLTQVLGFVRWPIMMPYLADTYADPRSSQATRDAVAVTYEAFNRYAGMAIGEHLGWVFTAVWVGLISVAMLRFTVIPRLVGLVGIAIGIAFLVSTIEQLQIGFEDTLGLLNFAVNTVFSVWLIALAVILLRIRSSTARRAA